MFGYNFDVNGKTYILRLSTQNIVALEQKLGCNPIAIFGDGTTIPKISDMVLILFYSLQQMNHGLTLNDAYKIFDEYLASGHIATDFIYFYSFNNSLTLNLLKYPSLGILSKTNFSFVIG